MAFRAVRLARPALWTLLGLALSLAGAGAGAAPARARATPPPRERVEPTLLIPARPRGAAPDSSRESPAAPLLVPGRPGPGDTLVLDRAQRAQKHFASGQALERAGSPAAAAAAYRSALLADPDLPEANLRLGLLFLSVNQIEEARKCFAEEVRRHPDDVAARHELALAHARLGRDEESIPALETLARERPADPRTWQALGFAYMAARRPKDAERALRRAATLPPPNAIVHRDLGAVLAAQGRLADARREYQRALEVDPHDASVWVNLGNLEQREGKPERALEAYRQAEARDSTEVYAIDGQVGMLRRLGREAEAGAAFRRWLRFRPDDHRARFDAVRLYDALGRPDQALELARDGVRYDARSSEARMILGLALQASGDSVAALRELSIAERLSPKGLERDRVRALIAALRRGGVDSLRAPGGADTLAAPETRR